MSATQVMAKRKARSQTANLFDSRPLKVGNRLNPGACRWSVIHCCKALDKSHKFASDLIAIEGLSKKL
jgi:hypothetical protein